MASDALITEFNQSFSLSDDEMEERQISPAKGWRNHDFKKKLKNWIILFKSDFFI